MSDKQKSGLWFGLLLLFLGAMLIPIVHRILNTEVSLSSQSVELLFKESITKVIPTKGDALEVAVLESFDTLTRRDTKTIFDLLYLGTTVSEIKVKVTYRYHILISDNWKVVPSNDELHITAPQIRPTLPPSIHTDMMEKKSEAGWLRFNAKENLESLEKSLTPVLASMSVTPAKIVLVRESSRTAIENFIRNWVLSRDEWREYRFSKIKLVLNEDVLKDSVQ